MVDANRFFLEYLGQSRRTQEENLNGFSNGVECGTR